MRKNEEALTQLLSRELNCAPEDFRKRENVLTVSVPSGGRVYQKEPYFFHMATLGFNTVVTADERLHPFLREYMRGEKRQMHWLMEIPNLLPLEKELNRFGYTLTKTYHMFLSDGETVPQGSLPVKWYNGKAEIEPFYGDARFPNAICASYQESRPDRIAVCAFDGEKMMGMAGCSEDAPGWQQIGIDVLPEYRSRGVAAFLVTLLKNEILRRGDIPFYGTNLANYHSWNTALNSGFRPAWVEIGAARITSC